MTTITDIQTIKHLVDQGHTVYARNRAYTVIKDDSGQYLIEYLDGTHCIGLHGRPGTQYENQLNMTPIFID